MVKKLSYIYLIIVTIAGCEKAVTAPFETVTNAENVTSKMLIISAWFPFDKQEYYWVNHINVVRKSFF